MGPTHFLFLYLLTTIVVGGEGHKTPAYSHQSSAQVANPSWQGSLRDDLALADLSLPGTHETMATSAGGDIAHCQALSLQSQLNSGIRALDIRCRHISNTFAIHHGLVFQNAYFGDVLCTLTQFLSENPSEFVLMRVKEEYTPVNNTRSFTQTFESYRNQSEFSPFFWTPTTNYPRVGEVRGKIILLDNFSSSSEYGLNWGDFSLFNIQDHYEFHSNWDLYRKWLDIKAQLMKADASRVTPRPKPLFVNFLSGSGGSFPYFVASGHVTHGSEAPRLSTGFTTLTSRNKWIDFPRVNCIHRLCTIAFEGTNVLTYEYLRRESPFTHIRETGYTGIIFADFPGPGLIQTVISLNAPHFHATPKWELFTLPILLIPFTSLLLTLALLFIVYTRRAKEKVNLVPSITSKSPHHIQIVH